MDKLLNLAEVATVLRASKQGARRWLAQGLIKSSKIGGDWRVKESDLAAFIESQVWIPPVQPDTDQDKEQAQ